MWLTNTEKKIGPLRIIEVGKNQMERSQKNPIRIQLLEDFGDIEKLSVRQDGSKKCSEWHLAHIELSKSGEKSKRFNFDRWIKEGKIYDSDDLVKLKLVSVNDLS